MESKAVALVTGASRGIGAATAIALARRGYDIAVSARTLHEGEAERRVALGADRRLSGSIEKVVAEIEAMGRRALAVPLDLTDREAAKRAAERVLDEFGRCDALCNIGVYQEPEGEKLFLDAPLEDLVKHLEASVISPAILCKTIIPVMIAQGGGTIFNMTSYVTSYDPPSSVTDGGWSLPYAAGKAGLDRFAGVMNAELRDRGVVAFNGDPGFVAIPEIWDAARAKYPDGPLCPPEAIGEAVAWVVTEPEARDLFAERVYLPEITQKYELLPGWGGPGSPWPVHG